MFKLVFFIIAITALEACSHTAKKQVSDNNWSLREKLIVAYEDKDWNKIVLLTDSLIARKDTIGDVLIPYAEALASTGKIEKSKTLLSERIKIEPKNYYLYQALGNIHCISGDTSEGIAMYKKVIDMRPFYVRPYVNLGMIYHAKKMNHEAIGSYEKAIDLFDEYGMFDEMEAYSFKILHIDSTNISAYKFLQRVYARKKDYPALWEVSVKIDDLCERQKCKKPTENIIFLGEAAYQLGEFDVAKTIFLTAISDKNTYKIYGYTACCYVSACFKKLNMPKEAEEYSKMARTRFKMVSASDVEEYIGAILNGR